MQKASSLWVWVILIILAFPGSVYAGNFDSCTQDCSGHEAGYNWAEEQDISDPDDCDGNSESFIEGCQTYAEEQLDSQPSEDSYEEQNNEDAEEE